jgi:predicted nucleic acid-binding protein
MTNKRFALDTNILIYLEGNDAIKRNISENLLSYAPVIPSQVATEFLNVTRRLRNISKLQALTEAAELFSDCQIAPMQSSTINLAIKLIKKYDFQLFDSLIVALALEADCEILYTEDMQHNLLVDKKLRIINPFVAIS